MTRKLANEELDRKSIPEFKKAEKSPFVIVLDNIRSMHNVGSIFRTADAFLVEKIVLTGITAQPPHREIHKTALGATESVHWEYLEDVTEAVKNLKSEGYKILVLEQTDPGVSIETFVPKVDEKYVLIFGNEVFGVSADVVKLADSCLEIPQFGTKHSLNVSVSAGIALWEVFRKWHQKERLS